MWSAQDKQRFEGGPVIAEMDLPLACDRDTASSSSVPRTGYPLPTVWNSLTRLRQGHI